MHYSEKIINEFEKADWKITSSRLGGEKKFSNIYPDGELSDGSRYIGIHFINGRYLTVTIG